MRFAPFFFFLNFGLNRPFQRFRPIWPIPADTGANRPDSEPHRCESAQVGFKKKKDTWHDAAGRAGSGVPRASPRPTRVRHLRWSVLHRSLDVMVKDSGGGPTKWLAVP